MDETFEDAVRRVLLTRRAAQGAPAPPVSRPASLKPVVVLDVGAGSGAWLASLEDRFPDVELHGLDVLPRPVELPRAITYHGQTAPPLPFADASLDLVHARKLLSSLQQKGALAALVQEMARCLRIGGLAVVVEGRQAERPTASKGPRGLVVGNLARAHLARAGGGASDEPLATALPALMRAHGLADVRSEALEGCSSDAQESVLERPGEGQARMIVFWGRKN